MQLAGSVLSNREGKKLGLRDAQESVLRSVDRVSRAEALLSLVVIA